MRFMARTGPSTSRSSTPSAAPAPRLVHGRLRLHEDHALAVTARSSAQRLMAPARHGPVPARPQPVDHAEAGVVARTAVAPAGVAEADDEPHRSAFTPALLPLRL